MKAKQQSSMSDSMGKRFAVSIVWSKPIGSATNIANSLSVVIAANGNEAFGLAYEDGKKHHPEHVMLFHTTAEIQSNSTEINQP